MDITSALTVTFNARALIDLPIADGGALKPRFLYRSDALSGLTEGGVEALGEYGIGTVIDLRTDGERGTAANRLPDDGSVEVVELPLLAGDMASLARDLLVSEGGAPRTEEQLTEIVNRVPTLEELYTGMLGTGAARFAALGRAVAASALAERPGVLIHCTAGKDRTGVATALLLELAGVTREAIVADYALTGENLTRGFATQMTERIASFGIPLTPRLVTLTTESPAAAIETALDWVRSNHGSAAAYFESGGMSVDEVAALRMALRAA